MGSKYVTVSKEFANQIDERMVKDPSLFAWAAEVLRELRKGSWLQSYVDSLFQLGRGEVDIYAAYCFGVIHGEVMTAAIELGHCPHSDDEVGANSAMLRDIVSVLDVTNIVGSWAKKLRGAVGPGDPARNSSGLAKVSA